MNCYSEKDLYEIFNPKDVCFVISKEYEWIDETSFTTDDLKETKKIAKECKSNIYIYKKKFVKDCCYPDTLFQDMLDSLECEGITSEFCLDCIGEEGQKEFKDMYKKWFIKYIGDDSWFADELLGMLKDET